MLRDSLGYDANPAIVLVVRAPDGGKLDLAAPAVRREVDRLAGGDGERRVRRPRRQPAARPRAGAALIARDGESLAIAGHLSTKDIEDAGGVAAEDVKTKVGSSPLDVADRRLRPELQRGQRPDPQGPDQGRADRLPGAGDDPAASSSAA